MSEKQLKREIESLHAEVQMYKSLYESVSRTLEDYERIFKSSLEYIKDLQGGGRPEGQIILAEEFEKSFNVRLPKRR